MGADQLSLFCSPIMNPGAPVPEKLENALARQEHEKAGELNLSLPEPEEEDDSVAA